MSDSTESLCRGDSVYGGGEGIGLGHHIRGDGRIERRPHSAIKWKQRIKRQGDVCLCVCV